MLIVDSCCPSVSLPEDAVSGSSLVPLDHSVNEVDPSELFDSTNDFFSGRQSRRQGKALRLEQATGEGTSELINTHR